MKQRGPLASMAQQGVGTDTMVGHLTPGEVVIPRKLTAEDSVMRKLKEAFEANGLNFQQYVVGADANRPNPHTGAPMFEGGGDPGNGGSTGSSDGGTTGPGDGGGGTTGPGEGGHSGMGAEGGTAHGGGGGTTGPGEGGGSTGPGEGGGSTGPGYGGDGNTGPGAEGGGEGEGEGEGDGGRADAPSPGAQEVSGPLSALGLGNVFGGQTTDRNAAVGQIGGGPNATPGIGPGSLNEAAANIATTSGGPDRAAANADAIGDAALSAAVAAALGANRGAGSDEASSESDAANMPSARGMPVSGQMTQAQLAALGLSPGMNTATVNALGPGVIGSIGGTTALGNTGFGVGGAQGQVSGTIGGSVAGGPNANFGDPGITGYGGAMSAAADAAAEAAAAAASATGGIAGMAGPDSYGGFDLGGISSNDQNSNLSAPFGGQSVGMAPGAVAPSVGMGFGTDKTGISMGAPYAGADVNTGMLGAGGVPGSRGDARAEQQAQLAQQAAQTITGVGATPQQSLASLSAQKAAAAQQQQQAPMQAPAQAPAPTQQAASPLAQVSSPSFNPASIAAALASMGTRPGTAASTDEEGQSAAPSRAGVATAAPTVSVAGQPARSASSIAAPEKPSSAFSNVVSSIFSPSNIGTVAINTGLGMLNPAVAAALQGASYLGTGQSVGANLTGLASGQSLQAGGLLGAVLGGGPTAGYGIGASNPNLSSGGEGGGGGNYAGIGPGSGAADFSGRLSGPTATTGAGSIPTSSGQFQTPFDRSFQGLPTNLTQYGYGPQYTFYAAQGGRVEGPLSKMRRG